MKQNDSNEKILAIEYAILLLAFNLSLVILLLALGFLFTNDLSSRIFPYIVLGWVAGILWAILVIRRKIELLKSFTTANPFIEKLLNITLGVSIIFYLVVEGIQIFFYLPGFSIFSLALIIVGYSCIIGGFSTLILTIFWFRYGKEKFTSVTVNSEEKEN